MSRQPIKGGFTAFLLVILTLIAFAYLPHTYAGEIVGVIEPSPGPVVINSGTTMELRFGANFSDATQSMSIIRVNYSSSGFNYHGFTATMNGVNISDQFDVALDVNSLILNCSAIEPVDGALQIKIFFKANNKEGNYTFIWHYWHVAFQEPPYTPTMINREGETQVEVKVVKVIIDDYQVSDNRCDVGSIQTLRLHASWNNGTDVKAGTIFVNGTSYFLNKTGWATFSANYTSVGRRSWIVTGVNCSGVTLYEQTIPDPSIIWDQIEIVSIGFSDSRINVGEETEVRYVLRYDYDDLPFTAAEGNVTISGSPASYDEQNSWWERTFVQSTTVQATLYDENDISVTDTVYGLTAVEDADGVNLVTDRVVIYWESLNTSRVNVGENIEWRVKAVLDYDNEPLGDGDSLNCSWGALSFDNESGWWTIRHKESSVMGLTIGEWAALESTYGITTTTENITETIGIWDRVQVVGYTVSDPRVDVGSNVTVDVSLIYDYDDAAVVDGVVTINGVEAAHHGSGVWRIVDSRDSVQAVTYETVAVYNNQYNITIVDQNNQNASVIWDQIKILSLDALDRRIDVGTEGNWYATAELEYDHHPLGAGDHFTLDGYLFTWDEEDGRFEATVSKQAVQSVVIDEFDTGLEETYGITVGSINNQSAVIIWDQIKVYAGGASPEVIERGYNSTIWFKTQYAYDGAQFDASSGELYVNDSSCEWSDSNSRWEFLTKEREIGNYTYKISGVTDYSYGLSTLNDLVGSIRVTITARLLKVNVSTDRPRYTLGDTIFVSSNIIYNSTKEPVNDGSFIATIKNSTGATLSTVPLKFVSDGLWIGNYTIKYTDPVGLWTIAVSGQDSANNAGSGSTTIDVNSFVLYVSPENITLIKGLSQNATITAVAMHDFNSTISLSILDLPAGVNPIFNTTKLTPGIGFNSSACVALNASLSAPTGKYPITVRAESGNLIRNVTFYLSIPKPVYSISAAPDEMVLIVGNSTDIDITVEPVPEQALTREVNLSIPNLPRGFQATFTPNSGTPPFNSTLHLVLTQDVKPGNHELAILGSSKDVAYNATSGDTYNMTIFYNTTITISVPTPSYSLSADSSALSAYVGETVNASLTIQSINGFSKPVLLFVTAPIGIKPRFNPNPVTPPANNNISTTLTLDVSAKITPGTHLLTITAASGNKSRVQLITLKVMDYSLSSKVDELSAEVGSSVSTNITVRSINGFNSSVNLLVDCTANLTTVFTPNPITPAPNSYIESKMTITVDQQATPGTYNLTIYGVRDGVNRSTTISLTIPTPIYNLSASQDRLILPINSSNQLTITALSLRGFNAPINLTSSPVAGLNVTFTPSTIIPPRGGAVSSLVTFTASDNVTLGDYIVKIDGVSGGTVRSLNITVSIADFGLNLNRHRIAIRNGTQSSLAVTIKSLNNFQSPVTLTLHEPPAGVSANFTPSTVSPPGDGSTTSIMDVDMASYLPPNTTYNLMIIGSSGNISHKMPLVLKVPPIPEKPDFTITASPTAIILTKGSKVNLNLTITSLNNFSSPVELTTSEIIGITSRFASNPILPSKNEIIQTLLSLESSSEVETGVYTLFIRGTSINITHSVNITLTIPDYELSAQAESLQLKAGEKISTNITVISINGFNDYVNLSASMNPNINASFSPQSILPPTGGVSTSVLTITVDPTTSAGDYLLTITGQSGSTLHNLTLNLRVQDFLISSHSVTLSKGSSNTTEVTINGRNGFSSSVNLLAPVLPAGVSATFIPNPVTVSSLTTSSLILSASTDAAPGNYNVTIMGQSPTMNRTTIITLTIPQPRFTITPDPSIITLEEYGVCGSNLVIKSINGWDEPINLTYVVYDGEGAINEGLNVTISPETVTPPIGGFATSYVSIIASKTTGTYNLMITDTGLKETSTNITIVVLKPLNASTVTDPDEITPDSPLELNGTYHGSGLRGVYLILTEVSGKTFLSIGKADAL